MRQLKPWSARETSHHPLIWASIIHTCFSLIYPVDELSFKEMRIWGQPKTSSCCLCVWCKNQEAGESTRLPTSMMESFSADFLSAMESYWTFRILPNINDGATLRKYVERLQMIALMMVILMVFYTYGELILRGVDPILGNGQKQPLEVFLKKRCSQKFRKIHRKTSVTEKHFPVDFAKFLRKPFFQNISGRLLLNGYGIQGQLLQESEMLAKLQSRKYQSKILTFCS